jgi:hypothetical protein
VDISPRKKLIHTLPPNTDRPINRAVVVGCAVSATRNHLKLHKPRRLKILFSNNHAKTLKLWKHSAMRLATSEGQYTAQVTRQVPPIGGVATGTPGAAATVSKQALIGALPTPSFLADVK